MSVSTTCSLFWTDVNDNVVEVAHDQAVCDSSLTTCTITGTSGGQLSATCDGAQHFPDFTSGEYTEYFCVCGGNSVSIPAGVTCSPACYDLNTQFSSCNLVWVYNGFTSGSASNGIKEDSCESFICDSTGVECTDSQKKLLYQCDNQEHQSQVASDSTDSYICNCAGSAQIPQLYQGVDGKTQGTGCGGSGGSSNGGGSEAGSSDTTGAASNPTGTAMQSAAGALTTYSAASVASVANSAPANAATTATPPPATTSPSSGGDSSSGGSSGAEKVGVPKAIVVLLAAGAILHMWRR